MVPDICFLDRDGTLIKKAPEGGYVGDPAEVELLPGAAGAVRDLTSAGAVVHVVTNQRGVARGLMTSEDVDRVNAHVAGLVAAEGGRIDGWWVCPHERDACTCRKPLPGLLRAALATLPSARPDRCVVIGDAESDMVAGRAAGFPGSCSRRPPRRPPRPGRSALTWLRLRRSFSVRSGPARAAATRPWCDDAKQVWWGYVLVTSRAQPLRAASLRAGPAAG